MIIRLLRGLVPSGQERALVARIRAMASVEEAPPGFGGATFGVRRGGQALGFVALSTWASIESISRASGGSPTGTWPTQPSGGQLADISIDLFEVAEVPLASVDTRAAALGLVWATIAPHAEPAVHDMIRATASGLDRAGVTALHVGRRVIDGRTELLVVASWRDRLSLHAFARDRDAGVIDPAFLRLVMDWRFETYDCIGPVTGELPLAGPAILLADDTGRYIDASPEIEALIGLPAELVLRLGLGDLIPPEARAAAEADWAAFLRAGEASGPFELARSDGSRVPVRFRAQANCPQPGIHASVLCRPEESEDPRWVDEIVRAALPTWALTPT